MLLVPFALGTTLGGWTWAAGLLLAAWLLAYLDSYYVSQYLRANRKQRFLAPIRVYTLLLVPVAGILLYLQPWLAIAALAFVPFSLVTAYYSHAGRPRALPSGLASVTQACLMAPLAYAFGGGDDGAVAASVFAVTWLYFIGVLLYVKTVIRERGDPTYLRVSIAFHLVALAAALWINPWFALPFALYLTRALVIPQRTLRPGQIGAIEIVNSILLVVTVLLAS